MRGLARYQTLPSQARTVSSQILTLMSNSQVKGEIVKVSGRP